MKIAVTVFLSLATLAPASRTEMIRNEKVIATEEVLRPAAIESSGEGFASVTVFLSDGSVSIDSKAGKPVARTVQRGDVIYRRPHDGKIRAEGMKEVRFVRIEFRGQGSADVWGGAGLAPNYRLLLENDHARVYDIRIPAGTREPRHTHHDRVVVCLSGAQLRHVLTDGHEEDSTLETGQCLWRRGQTHVGKNIGATDLWVVAVEPK